MASPVQSRFRTKNPVPGLAKAGILALVEVWKYDPDERVRN